MLSHLLTMTGVTSAECTSSEPAEAETARGLVATIQNDILVQIEATQDHVPRFAQACADIDLEGRCQRLSDHLQKLSESPTVDTYEEDLLLFQALFKDLARFLKTLNEAKLAPPKCWDRWLRRGGKYARRMARINNKLNDIIADHILHVQIYLPDAEVVPKFPPTVEEMLLSPPSSREEEEDPFPQPSSGGAAGGRYSTSRGGRRASGMSIASCPTFSGPSSGTGINCSIRSTRSSRSTPGALGSYLNDNNNDLDSSMHSNCSFSVSGFESITEGYDGMNGSASNMFSTVSREEDSGLHRIAWDFSPRTVKQDKWWGSSSNVTKSRKDRQELYVKTQVLRDIPQDSKVKELRVVLAQLEAGDTSPGIVAGRAAMMAVGALGALMVSPLVVMGGLSAKEAVTQTPLEAAAVFSHYLIEFELENGTIGTIENCVEDIYLYAGRSSRAQQHCVSRIPMIPGLLGSPDSLSQPLLLQDLIRFRNEQRMIPYRLWDNNCKHFVYLALTNGQLFPKASNYEEDSLDVFFALCQGCYVQKDCFDVFTESHQGQLTRTQMAQQIMTLWEQEQNEEEGCLQEKVTEEDDDGDTSTAASTSEEEDEGGDSPLKEAMETPLPQEEEEPQIIGLLEMEEKHEATVVA